MSPRSAEMLLQARDDLAAAETLVDAGHPAATVSRAYYATLYAARAALSERDRNARSHTGTGQLFREEFVLSGQFDADLAAAAQGAQERREAGDYRAERFELAEVRDILDVAQRFVAAVDQLIG